LNVSIIEVLIAALSLVAAWYLGMRAERSSINQYRLSASAFASDWIRDLRNWASEAIDVLSEAAYMAQGRHDTEPMDQDTKRSCRYRLSALIDRGRFFIPNYTPDDIGLQKPPAFRGIRHPALDFLVAAEQMLSNADPELIDRFGSVRGVLIAIKREFVSEIQEILDPRSQNKAIADLIKLSRGDTNDKRSALQKLIALENSDYVENGWQIKGK
jgi:hypothetical protein